MFYDATRSMINRTEISLNPTLSESSRILGSSVSARRFCRIESLNWTCQRLLSRLHAHGHFGDDIRLARFVLLHDCWLTCQALNCCTIGC